MTGGERYQRIRVKLDWAEKHINELYVEQQGFFASNPYTIRRDVNPETRERSFYIDEVRSGVPLAISAIVGDAIHNMRSALDHLAHHLVHSNKQRVGWNTGFPIYSSAEEFETKFSGKVKGMGDEAIKLIRSIQPYKGGDDSYNTLWKVSKLDNADKHRLLVSVSCTNRGHSLTPSERADFIRTHPAFPTPNFNNVITYVPPNMGALKAGDHLLTIPESEMEEYVDFVFSIAFAEPRIIGREPIVPALNDMFRFVRYAVVERFKVFLS